MHTLKLLLFFHFPRGRAAQECQLSGFIYFEILQKVINKVKHGYFIFGEFWRVFNLAPLTRPTVNVL